MPNLQGYFNQTYTVEFQVPGALDGVTLSPAISATIPAAKDPQSMYRPEVVTDDNPDGNLGLIDVDYLVSEFGADKVGARGNRYVAWIWIEANEAGGAGAALEVVDAVDGSVAVQQLIADLTGLTTYYKNDGILVPQGSMLRISGFQGGEGPPAGAKVRLHIAGLTDEGLVAVQAQLCCADGGGNGGQACCPPVLLDDTMDEITFFGGDENDTLDVEVLKIDAAATIELQPPTGGLSITSSNIATGNPISSVTVDLATDSEPDNGTSFVVATNPCGCCVLLGKISVVIA